MDYLFFLYKDNYVSMGGGSRPIQLYSLGRATIEIHPDLQRLRALSRQAK
jgi:hypothetical protein